MTNEQKPTVVPVIPEYRTDRSTVQESSRAQVTYRTERSVVQPSRSTNHDREDVS